MNLESQYEKLKEKIVERRKPFDAFINMLETETSWLTSPASSRFHLCEEKGLLKHSVGVAENLLKFRAALAPQISEESCVIVGLFHDVGKIGMPGKPLYLPNETEWEIKKGIKYKINREVVAMGLAMRSIYLITKYMPLSDAEAQAITYHDGQYIEDNKIVAHKEEPLTLLAHWADYWTAHIFEEGREIVNETAYYDKDNQLT